jgi:hypothetical protein
MVVSATRTSATRRLHGYRYRSLSASNGPALVASDPPSSIFAAGASAQSLKRSIFAKGADVAVTGVARREFQLIRHPAFRALPNLTMPFGSRNSSRPVRNPCAIGAGGMGEAASEADTGTILQFASERAIHLKRSCYANCRCVCEVFPSNAFSYRRSHKEAT